MAICEDCKGDMLVVDGCRESEIKFRNKWYKRSQSHWCEPGERCHDCGAKHGHYHHMGSDEEECPKCGGQLISCGCITKKTLIRFRRDKKNGKGK